MVPARVVCEVCREDTHAITRFAVHNKPSVRYAEHLGPDRGMCAGSNTVVSNRSRLPGWHFFHECGMFCDGQDGSSSQCAESKRRGPPSIVDVIGGIQEG